MALVIDDAALRADVGRLTALVGESLVRQEGDTAPDLAEQVRQLTKSGKEDGGRTARPRPVAWSRKNPWATATSNRRSAHCW